MSHYTDGSGLGHERGPSSALVADLPKDFDLEHDILVPGKATNFQRQVKSGLRSRDLLSAIVERQPTLQQVADANPDLSGAEVSAALDNILMLRHKRLGQVADLMPSTIRLSSLQLMEQEQFNKLVASGDGAGVYLFLMVRTDVSRGKPQDLLRTKYAAVKVKVSDSADSIIKAVELKWWLFKHNTLFTTDTLEGTREGVRAVLMMLLSGPERIAAEAAQSLILLESLTELDGDSFITDRVEVYKRYGDALVNTNTGGTLMAMQKQLDEAKAALLALKSPRAAAAITPAPSSAKGPNEDADDLATVDAVKRDETRRDEAGESSTPMP